MPKLSEWLFGSKDKMKKLSNFSPGQERLFGQIGEGLSGAYGDTLSLLQQYLNPQSELYQNFEAPYLQQFEQDYLPRLAEQYAGAGALSSSGFGQSLGGAAAQLQAQLAGLKSQIQRQSIQDILGQSSDFLRQQPFTYQHKQGNQGILGSALGGFAQGLGGAAFSGLGSLGSLFGGGSTSAAANMAPAASAAPLGGGFGLPTFMQGRRGF